MVSVKISSHHIVLPLETAVPLGLLVNELMANSIAESRRSGKAVDIKINIFDNENGTFSMYYFDSSSHDVLNIKDGRVIDIENGLMDLLITQLEGNIQSIPSTGLTYKINFNGSNYQTRLAFLM
jgi:two-component sensor histidine kinase